MAKRRLVRPASSPSRGGDPNAIASILGSLKGKVGKKEPVPIQQSVKHIVVRAYAGTGKTFTQIVGCAHAYGSRALWGRLVKELGFDPQPSDEQAEVWAAMKEQPAQSIVYCAFNKSIVQEFSMKWGWLVEALRQEGVQLTFATINSLGYKCCYQLGRCQVNTYKTGDLISEVLDKDIRELRKTEKMAVNAMQDLVRYCKLGLVGWDSGAGLNSFAITDGELDDLCKHYNVDLDGSRDKVYDTVRKVLQKSFDMTWKIDFDDQNWLPIVKGLVIPQSDLLLVDEAQDLNRCKQEFVLRGGKRLMVVGDVHQAIYGFAGADVESIPRMERMLGDVQVLRLTETRRCGKAIVEEARKVVPDFKAHESNPDGEILTMSLEKYSDTLQDDDAVLCRVNAPLVSQALRRLKLGKKAVIIGRDFGGQLIKFIESLQAVDVADLMDKVQSWYDNEAMKENKGRNPDEAKLINLADKRDCVLAFCDDSTSVGDVTTKINRVFSGKECPKCHQHYDEEYDRCFNKGCKTEYLPGDKYPVGPLLIFPKGVQFSSGHRAKGKEWKNVYVLYPELIPHPMAKTAWQREQESNLKYVIVTRAINRLIYVTK